MGGSNSSSSNGIFWPLNLKKRRSFLGGVIFFLLSSSVSHQKSADISGCAFIRGTPSCQPLIYLRTRSRELHFYFSRESKNLQRESEGRGCLGRPSLALRMRGDFKRRVSKWFFPNNVDRFLSELRFSAQKARTARASEIVPLP